MGWFNLILNYSKRMKKSSDKLGSSGYQSGSKMN